jgi:hypothetical protein
VKAFDGQRGTASRAEISAFEIIGLAAQAFHVVFAIGARLNGSVSSAFFIGRANHQSIKSFITINDGSNNLRKTTRLLGVIE